MENSMPPSKGSQQVTAASLRRPCGIGDLPPELLMMIFQFFDVLQLDSIISRVCRLWRDLSRRPCLRLDLTLNPFYENTSAHCKLIRSCPNLNKLFLMDYFNTDQLLNEVSLYNHKLRRLALMYCTGSPFNCEISMEILNKVFLHCPHLEEFLFFNDISCNNRFVLDEGVHFPELRKITFSCCSFFGSNELREMVLRCNKLEEIHLLKIYFVLKCCDQDFAVLAQHLSGTLKVLKIDGENLSDEAFSALSQCCQLRELHVANTLKITDKGVSHLSQLKNLETLGLTHVKMVSSIGWVRMFSMSRWRKMEDLMLCSCLNVNDDTLHQVAIACPNLVNLHLNDCWDISEKGLSSVFQSCKMLEYLDIDSARNNVYRSFPLIPIHTPNLKWLFYFESGVKEEKRILMDLQECLPNLKIN